MLGANWDQTAVRSILPMVASWEEKCLSLFSSKKMIDKRKWPELAAGKFSLDIRKNFSTESVTALEKAAQRSG